jgi:hypothetical protein
MDRENSPKFRVQSPENEMLNLDTLCGLRALGVSLLLTQLKEYNP